MIIVFVYLCENSVLSFCGPQYVVNIIWDFRRNVDWRLPRMSTLLLLLFWRHIDLYCCWRAVELKDRTWTVVFCISTQSTPFYLRESVFRRLFFIFKPHGLHRGCVINKYLHSEFKLLRINSENPFRSHFLCLPSGTAN